MITGEEEPNGHKVYSEKLVIVIVQEKHCNFSEVKTHHHNKTINCSAQHFVGPIHQSRLGRRLTNFGHATAHAMGVAEDTNFKRLQTIQRQRAESIAGVTKVQLKNGELANCMSVTNVQITLPFSQAA